VIDVYESFGRLIWRRITVPCRALTGFRDEMVRRMLAGESVSQPSSRCGMLMQTLHGWKHQVRVDTGLAEGIDSIESTAWRAICNRSTALERELQLFKDAL